MAHPKRRQSKTRTAKRRTHDKAVAPTLSLSLIHILSGRLRHVLSPAEAVPETLTGYLCLGIGTGNRTGRSEGLP